MVRLRRHVYGSQAPPDAARPGDVLELPTIGEVRISDSLYVMHEGSSTIGLLVGRDRLEQSCVLALSLERTNGPNSWRGIVERVTRAGGHSADGIGASFCFSSPSGDPERGLKAVSVR
jgi:hypothetical protein